MRVWAGSARLGAERAGRGAGAIAASKGNHGGRPKVIDDDSLTFALALKNKGIPVPDIAKKLTIKGVEERIRPIRR
ncbi:hypothetical protein [Nocardia sp. NPDC058497]|uniref:hypothetical protein n=1 Tax=Nocardia sp. NPDC058497 TaxID=3346529 RepID=UPI00364EE52A